jgi:DNA-directed RNA polymerase specialized sigma24 family protein
VRRQAGGIRAKEYQEAAGVPVDAVAGMEDCLSFWHAYSCLSATCRGIFHYVVFAGYSHREAAPRIGIPPGTMHHLKQKCQETFLYHFNGGAHAG